MNFDKVKKAGRALTKASSKKAAALFLLIQQNPQIFQKELSRLSGFTQVETSIHLKALVACKIVTKNKEGTKVYYTQNLDVLDKISTLATLINS